MSNKWFLWTEFFDKRWFSVKINDVDPLLPRQSSRDRELFNITEVCIRLSWQIASNLETYFENVEIVGNSKIQLYIFERVELGAMAKMFFNKVGVFLFYLCIIVYLYGDLAIYAAAVPKNIVSILLRASFFRYLSFRKVTTIHIEDVHIL